MSEAHVIQCNDSVECVVLGYISEALRKKEELRFEDFERNRFNYTDWEQYVGRCHWQVRTVLCVRYK